MKDPIRITTATRLGRRIRRLLSRNEWVVWLLGLSRTKSKPTEPGLILVQIDGLSRKQLESAIDHGRMPFLNSLLQKDNYLIHTLYSGLPSSTPSVQAELYYGVPTAVPAFGFRDHRTGHLVRMFGIDIAREVESRLQQVETGLLSGGSSYCNIYSGGAKEVHFCATSFGWSEFLRTVNPLKILLVALLNFWMFFRAAGLVVIEFFLAIFGFFRGILSGRQFRQELIMIPARVLIVVLLRELATVGVCFDVARGQPIIHVNLLGYDEQAHSRGPGSRLAHWTLRGIDHSIRKIWTAAHRGAGREYDLWVFSDHGQEKTEPYQLTHGRLIQQVVAEMVEEGFSESIPHVKQKLARLPTRANWLGLGWLVSMLFGEQDHDVQTRSTSVQTVTSGPIGFVHFLTPELKQRRDEFALRLVREFDVPMVVRTATDNTALVTTADGAYFLPADAERVFGSGHPFLKEVNEDLIRLVQHPDAGDLVLIGWTGQPTSTSFGMQSGAHAGPGVNETRAFAMLPTDVRPDAICDPPLNYLRPNDLRLAALNFLRQTPQARSVKSREFWRDRRIRILTYNVHGCVGMDGELSPERVARVIAQSGANVVCLQELDVFRRRSGNRDQAHAIAMHLEMDYQFHPAWHLEEEQFGNAILTRFPMRVIESRGIHHHKSDRSRRSALWVEIDVDDQTSIQIINTHLSIYPQEQLIQAQELMDQWVRPAALVGPVVLCGDFNARPKSATHKEFSKTLFDVESFDKNRTRSTYFSPFPVSRVDHVFVSHELIAEHIEVIESRIARVASDHLPLVADVKLTQEAKRAALNEGDEIW